MQLAQTSQKVRTQHEFLIRFVVDDVANADKLFAQGKRFQLGFQRFLPQMDPTHNAPNARISLGQLQEPFGLFQTLPRLHRNGAVQPNLCLLLPQILRPEIPPNRIHLFPLHPRILRRIVTPKMLMRVNFHKRKNISNGADGSICFSRQPPLIYIFSTPQNRKRRQKNRHKVLQICWREARKGRRLRKAKGAVRL